MVSHLADAETPHLGSPAEDPARSCGTGSERRPEELTDGLTDADVDRIFQALANTTRRDIIRRTLAADQPISRLAETYAMSFAAVGKHVAVLEGAGLVHKVRRGRERFVGGEPQTIRRAQRLLDRYEEIWRGRIARLDSLLAED